MIAEREKKKVNPIKDFMMSVMVGSSVEFQKRVVVLMEEYSQKGIDSIPIKTLKQFLLEATEETLSEQGLAGSYLAHMMEEDIDE